MDRKAALIVASSLPKGDPLRREILARLKVPVSKIKSAARYSNDPYWMVAKYPGQDKNGKPFRRGDRVFYYPLTKTILTGPEAEKASREFDSAAFDEDYGFRAAGKTAALPDGRVSTFMMVLRSKLTQYDAAQQKRSLARGHGMNIYALGHYLEAASKIEKAVSKVKDRDDEEALGILRKAILKFFTESGGVPDLPPVRNTVKQIDAFLSSGTLPSLTAR